MRSGGKQLATPCRDALAVRKQLTGVLEEDDAIAKEAPTLLRVCRDDMSSIAIERVSGRARWSVRARAHRTG